MGAQPLIVSLRQGLGRFGKEPGGNFPSNPRQGQHNRDIRGALSLARRLSQSAQQRADLLATGLQLLGEHTQTGQQELTMGLSRFGGARGHR
jgi:hypothetical protein